MESLPVVSMAVNTDNTYLKSSFITQELRYSVQIVVKAETLKSIKQLNNVLILELPKLNYQTIENMVYPSDWSPIKLEMYPV